MALTRGCSHKRVCGNLPSQAADTLTQLQAFAADEGPKGPSGSGLTAAQLAGAHSRQPRGRFCPARITSRRLVSAASPSPSTITGWPAMRW